MLRIAKEPDLPLVMDTARKFFKSTDYGHLMIDEEALEEMVRDFVTGDNRERIALVWGPEGKVQGCLAGQLVAVPFLKKKSAVECMWWVDEELRGSNVGIDLLEAFEYWGKLQGAAFIQMACLSNSTGKVLDRFYKRRGYKLTELTYTKEIS